jgi:hypothetical protein
MFCDLSDRKAIGIKLFDLIDRQEDFPAIRTFGLPCHSAEDSVRDRTDEISGNVVGNFV